MFTNEAVVRRLESPLIERQKHQRIAGPRNGDLIDTRCTGVPRPIKDAPCTAEKRSVDRGTKRYPWNGDMEIVAINRSPRTIPL